MRFAKRNVPHRRAVFIVWLVLCNMALASVYTAVGESLAGVARTNTRTFTDVFALSTAFIGWSLVAISWRRSVALGSAVQLALPVVALGFLWVRDRNRLLRLADITPAILMLVVGTGLVVTLIMYLQSRWQSPSD